MVSKIKITTLTGINTLTIGNGIVVKGTTSNIVMPTQAHCQTVINNIQFPMPLGIEIILLPFRITEVDGYGSPADGIAHYASKKIYLSAFWTDEFTTVAYRLRAWEKTLAHELGHLVHYAYLAAPQYGNPVGLWQTFKTVHNISHANNSYETDLSEAFAESWRLIFVPMTQHTPHRHGVNWGVIGLKEWMLSLTKCMTVAVSSTVAHNKIYTNGTVTQVDVPAQIVSGRTMVPLRFIAEQMGKLIGKTITTEWSDPNTVIIRVL